MTEGAEPDFADRLAAHISQLPTDATADDLGRAIKAAIADVPPRDDDLRIVMDAFADYCCATDRAVFTERLDELLRELNAELDDAELRERIRETRKRAPDFITAPPPASEETS